MKGSKNGRNLSVYKRYVCYRCFKRVNECTCKFYPPHSLIMIDEGVQDAVRMLNEKGFGTIGCCESHYKGVCQCIYVAFAEVNPPSPNLPEGFKWLKSKRSIIHEYNRHITAEDFEVEKTKHLKILREWADTL